MTPEEKQKIITEYGLHHPQLWKSEFIAFVNALPEESEIPIPYAVLYHPNHPCRGWDLFVCFSQEDVDIGLRQGYIEFDPTQIVAHMIEEFEKTLLGDELWYTQILEAIQLIYDWLKEE